MRGEIKELTFIKVALYFFFFWKKLSTKQNIASPKKAKGFF